MPTTTPERSAPFGLLARLRPPRGLAGLGLGAGLGAGLGLGGAALFAASALVAFGRRAFSFSRYIYTKVVDKKKPNPNSERLKEPGSNQNSARLKQPGA